MTYLKPADVTISDDYQAHKRRNSKEPGTDYETAYGTAFVAAGDGAASYTDHNPNGAEGRRLQIVLDDGRVIDYIHLAEIWVVQNQLVKAGQVLGLTGASGYGRDDYYDPHVHVTLRERSGLPYSDSIDFEPFTFDTTEQEDEEMYIANVKNGNFYLVLGKDAHLLGAESGARASGIPVINYPDDWAVQQLKAGGVKGIRH